MGYPSTTGPSEIVQLADDVESIRTRIVAELDATRSLNDRLARQAMGLEYSNRDLEQFAHVAGHDLQEPLRKVSGFCELPRSRYGEEFDERANTYIEFAVGGARRMSVLINDLLAFSRVGRGNVAPAPQDCERLLAAPLDNLEKVITETGARVTHDALPSVPGVGSLLTTLLQNLVGNGLKFRASEPPRIHIGVECDGEHWSFRVTDNGIRIDPTYAERIFPGELVAAVERSPRGAARPKSTARTGHPWRGPVRPPSSVPPIFGDDTSCGFGLSEARRGKLPRPDDGEAASHHRLAALAVSHLLLRDSDVD